MRVMEASRSGNGPPVSRYRRAKATFSAFWRSAQSRMASMLASTSCLRGVLGEEHLEQRFELERGAGAGFGQPRLQRPSALGGDRVDGARAAADVLGGRLGEAEGGEPLGFLVDAALGARPEVLEAALHLLGQLVGRPRLDGQQPEDRVRGRRELGC